MKGAVYHSRTPPTLGRMADLLDQSNIALRHGGMFVSTKEERRKGGSSSLDASRQKWGEIWIA